VLYIDFHQINEGALADKLGWRSIFWFLCISAAVCALVMILFLPETLRRIVGNGSVPPPRILRPLVPVIGRSTPDSSQASDARKPLANPLRLLLYPDIAILLVFNGLIYSVFYGVTASISTLFHEAYPSLTEADIGLCFLGIGSGMAVGSAFTGKILDWEYRNFKKRLIRLTDEKENDYPEGLDFPIEKARLRLLPFFLLLYVAACIGYGWCVDKKVNLAGPVVLLVAIGFVGIAVMNATQTLIIDLVPIQASSVTACNNLVRCSLGAALVAVINYILTALGAGWTYVLLGGVCVLVSPAVYVVVLIGPTYRLKRRQASTSSM